MYGLRKIFATAKMFSAVHRLTVQAGDKSSGDDTASADQPCPQKCLNRFFLSGVRVDTNRATPAVAIFGDQPPTALPRR
jgi:hypothetical protein